MERPHLDATLDASRAAERAADPTGWRYPDDWREVVARVIAERRDIRRFRADPVPEDVLERILQAAHRAPSVGLSQPWRFIVVRSEATRTVVRSIAQRERMRQAPKFDDKARQFLDQKVEGVLEAPLGICVCCVPPSPDRAVLGRGTIPETDVYSTACAIQNLWLAARAEGLGVGWVSFYRPEDLRAVLGIPPAVSPIAWLCVGWPDERPVRPGLERAGWEHRRPLSEVVLAERWSGADLDESSPAPDAAARLAVRDRSDELVKPVGSLGALEDVVERWAAATGAPPPARLRAAHVVFAGDHGHAKHGTSLFGSAVSTQVAAAAARRETAIGVLAAARGEPLTVVDVGLRGGTPAGCLARPLAAGTADAVARPAMTLEQAQAAIRVGSDVADELIADAGATCLVVGEIGIGNTTAAAALLCLLTGVESHRAVGRGTGLDAQGLARKRAAVEAIVARTRERGGEAPDGVPSAVVALAEASGFEFAALVGAIHAAHARRVPVMLDGFATGVCAMVAVAVRPTCREWLFAGHVSAEPAHALVLSELGLEPLLDLRLRLGEASGAALALPLVEAAGRMHRSMGTFAETGVEQAQKGAR